MVGCDSGRCYLQYMYRVTRQQQGEGEKLPEQELTQKWLTEQTALWLCPGNLWLVVSEVFLSRARIVGKVAFTLRRYMCSSEK